MAHLDLLEVERGEHQLDLAAGQRGLDLVGVAVQRHRRGLGDRAQLRPQERLGQRVRGGHDRAVPGGLPAVVPPGQRCLPGLGVHLVVIGRLDPRGEQPVELEQRSGRCQPWLGQVGGAGVGDFDEELIADRPEKPLDFASALGPVRGGVHQPDPELAAGPQQPRVNERRAVIDVAVGRHAAAGEGWFQRSGQPHGVLGEAEPVADRESGVIVEEREQVGLAAADARPVQRVADPPLVRCVGFEPAEDHRAADGGAHQLAVVEQPQQRGFRGRVARGCAQDPGDLRGGALRVLPLERDRQLQHPGVDPGTGLADRGHQRVEAAGPVAGPVKLIWPQGDGLMWPHCRGGPTASRAGT